MNRSLPEDLTVLLVEDHVLLAETVVSGLAAVGVPPDRVVHVTDLDRVPEALERIEPDVALLDLNLHTTTGLQTVERFTLLAPEVPFVVLTGNDAFSIAREALECGASDYVVKGTLDSEALARVLMNARVRHDLMDELRRSNEDLSRFAFVAAHDVKSPLRNVAQLSDLVLEDLRTGETHELEDLVGEIRRSALRAVRLVDDLLRYARLGSAIERAPVDLEHLVGDVWQAFSGELSGESRTVRFVVEELPRINADRRLLHHVFANLFENALHHNPSVDLEIAVRGRTVEGGWEIEVCDTGGGIPEEAHERIFEPFQRADTRTSGTGLGLSICQRIIEGHGGRITVDSAPGEGTTFRIFLPDAPGRRREPVHP